MLTLQMEESPKSPANGGVVAGNLPEFLDESDFDGELSPEFPIKEEMIAEVMQELYKEITCSSSSTFTSTVSPSIENIPSPSSIPSPLVADNGMSESCGASVSDSASTVMVGVEFMGMVAGRYGGGNAGFPVGCDCGVGLAMDGCDEVDFGDEWLDIVMGWDPLEG